MSTTVETTTEPTYTVSGFAPSFIILVNGLGALADRYGHTRYFSTRESARKEITRLNRQPGDRGR